MAPISRRTLFTLAAGGAAGVALPAPAWAVGDRRPGSVRLPSLTPDDREIAGQVEADRALQHLRVLADGIGARVAGTPGERQAADYLSGVLDGLGYRVTHQSFPVQDQRVGTLHAPGGLPADVGWQVGASWQAGLDVSARGGVVDVGEGDFSKDVAGRVVLIDQSWLDDPTVAVRAAIAGGAVAVVFLGKDHLDGTQSPAYGPWLEETLPIPVVGTGQSQKYALRELLAAGALPELIVSTAWHRGLTSHNVIAERPAENLGPVVMVSAHYDTVLGAPGANDDGSGTVLTLELARVLRHLPVDATLRFALWGAEEEGLIGSRHYVEQLPQAERERIVAVFQNDMVATSSAPATRYWLLSLDGEPNRATDEVAAAAQRLGYAPRISPVTARGSSDHQSFQEAGIAAANFSWRGEDGPWHLEPPYHSPLDTIARNISLERLQVSMELIGAACYATARRP
ncbi:M20/M25/M40 family metallo-hydrolase [Catenuloplanes japonicus]|uniref:M20/M25/M40 family metallo-hydrolase n=1 Tax=Catenuloplanes japonicus TaxID=33876 RepID=UPI0005261396|nr:M20/M25/M40 family metallo-hydrolase [Catenuloplanes japonicus]